MQQYNILYVAWNASLLDSSERTSTVNSTSRAGFPLILIAAYLLLTTRQSLCRTSRQYYLSLPIDLFTCMQWKRSRLSVSLSPCARTSFNNIVAIRYPSTQVQRAKRLTTSKKEHSDVFLGEISKCERRIRKNCSGFLNENLTSPLLHFSSCPLVRNRLAPWSTALWQSNSFTRCQFSPVRDVVSPLLRRSSSLSYAVDWLQQHCLLKYTCMQEA